MEKADYLAIPYNGRHEYPTIPDDLLADLYRQIKAEGSADWLFYGGGINSAEEFLNFVKSPAIAMFLAVSKKTGHPLAMALLDGFREKTAYAHFVFFQETWGKRNVEIGKWGVKYLLKLNSIEMLYGLVPEENKLAVKFAEKIGGKRMTPVLPRGAWNGQTHKPMPAVMFYFAGDDDENI